MKYSPVTHRTARLRKNPIAEVTRKLFTSDDDRARSPALATAMLAVSIGLVPHTAQAACSTTSGGSLLADAGSTCVTSGPLTLTMSGLDGAYATDPGSQIDLQAGAAIIGTGKATIGLHAANGGVITVGGPLMIDLPDGSGNSGVFVHDSGSRISLNGPVDITMGAGRIYSPGMLVKGGAVLITNGDVTIHTAGDSRSDAVAADTSSQVTLNGTLNLTTTGQQAAGLKVSYAANIDYNGQATFAVNGVNGSGIRAAKGGSVNAGASSTTVINVTGINGAGISSKESGSQVNLAGTTRIDVNAATQANVPNGNPESYATGLLSYAEGTIRSTGTLQISTTDATSYGALLLDKDVRISATGGGSIHSAGVAIGFLSGANQAASFDNFDISNTSGDLIQVNAATGSSALSLANSNAAAATGSRLMNVSGGSTFTLDTDHSTLSGDMVADAGSAASVNLRKSSSLSGTIDGTALNVDATSDWTMTGNSTLNQLTLAGRIDFQAPGASFIPRTLTVNGNWIGQGGTVQLHTVLGGDGSASDKLILNGGAASGSTKLRITNAGGVGATTTGNGILVVDTINGGTTTANAFSLASPVSIGAYSYHLFKGDVATGTSEDWYLRSSMPSVDSSGTVTQIPLFRKEVSLYAVAPAVVRAAGLLQISNFHTRQGDQTLLTGDTEQKASWGRAWSDQVTLQRDGTVKSSFDGKSMGLQTGRDLYTCKTETCGDSHFGVFLSYGHAQGDVKGNAEGIENLSVGNLSTDSYGVGAYWSRVGAGGWYADAVVTGNYLALDTHSDSLIDAKSHGTVLQTSLEAGLPIVLNSALSVEPQGQVIWQHLRMNDINDGISNAQFHMDNSTTVRVGLRVQGNTDGAFALWRPYFQADLLRIFNSTDNVAFDQTTTIPASGSNTLGQMGMGFVLKFHKSGSVYTNISQSYDLSGNKYSTLSANIGGRWVW